MSFNRGEKNAEKLTPAEVPGGSVPSRAASWTDAGAPVQMPESLDVVIPVPVEARFERHLPGVVEHRQLKR